MLVTSKEPAIGYRDGRDDFVHRSTETYTYSSRLLRRNMYTTDNNNRSTSRYCQKSESSSHRYVEGFSMEKELRGYLNTTTNIFLTGKWRHPS
ncbi:hypothetical protein J6590_026565 [Homalodisca vitripennis]|nr:hypothetical protein J6590_026565 [Homalodisca vitripennis]